MAPPPWCGVGGRTWSEDIWITYAYTYTYMYIRMKHETSETRVEQTIDIKFVGIRMQILPACRSRQSDRCLLAPYLEDSSDVSGNS